MINFVLFLFRNIKERSVEHSKLLEVIDYNPETGHFNWKAKRPRCRYKAGDRAGCYIKHLGYRTIEVLGKRVLEHRLAWFYTHGVWPKVIDHINRNRSDNRLANLRDVSYSKNAVNTIKHKGIMRSNWGWAARIMKDGNRLFLGTFATQEEAIKVYQKKHADLFGEHSPYKAQLKEN